MREDEPTNPVEASAAGPRPEAEGREALSPGAEQWARSHGQPSGTGEERTWGRRGAAARMGIWPGTARGSERSPAGSRRHPHPTLFSSPGSSGAGATARRRVGLQPRSLTWRPTSCHRACSGLPPLGPWGSLRRPPRLPPRTPPGRRLAAGHPRPRGIERKRLEGQRKESTTIEYSSSRKPEGRLPAPGSSVHSQSADVAGRNRKWG